MTIPFTYLGIPIGGNHRKREFWIGMIEKILRNYLGGKVRQYL